ncbi:MAG: DUF5671 domain-containing protein [Prochloraceae cyanobacterium]|nr:DUF5671 domain-containing protein [Prochloraceae cyanobacterium]
MAKASPEPPPPNSRRELVQFIQAARSKGASDEFISKLLRSFGWSQREIERAYFVVYEQLTGQTIPDPKRAAGESARDAFVYLLTFATLALWTQALGEMAFIFIDHFIPDALNRYYYGNPSKQVSFCLSRLIVAYPVFLLLMRQLNKELARYREKHSSGIRKWLTYLTLWIVSLIIICTVIVFLSSFLRGELTQRFVLKVLVILVINGGVLWYYLTWLQRRPTTLPV